MLRLWMAGSTNGMKQIIVSWKELKEGEEWVIKDRWEQGRCGYFGGDGVRSKSIE